MELTKEEALCILWAGWDTTEEYELYKIAVQTVLEEAKLIQTKYKREKESAKLIKTSIEVEISNLEIDGYKFSFYYNILWDNKTILAAKYEGVFLTLNGKESITRKLIDNGYAVELALKEYGKLNRN